ncbi:MAG: CehA/McbA family metallohydrolase [Acidobacteriota bacterium]|nr:CehA/McbA family metallohydrolase [Acidobacteriota bacterium]
MTLPRKTSPASVFGLVTCLVTLGTTHDAIGHGSEARYVEELDWPQDRVTRVIAAGRSELGVPGSRDPSETRTIDGRSCVVGPLVAFDIDDGYAYDIDEPVELTLTYAGALTGPFVVGWDQNGGNGFGVANEIVPAAQEGFHELSLTLDRARFAGQGIQRTDLAIGGRDGIALCGMTLERSETTPVPAGFGRLRLAVYDAETGRPVPARVGVYDTTGRAPLPSDQALVIHRFTDEVQLVWVNGRTPWPSDHRLAFYVTGVYETRLPVGTYELVVMRGPEYRAVQRTINIRADQTHEATVALHRFADLPTTGWFSGDSHVHLYREHADDLNVWGQVAAEDLHVANLLEMGNIAGTHFQQPAWGRAGRFTRDRHILVSGQEDPRTVHRGHTIHHNVQQPRHLDPDVYFLYHRVFEELRQQGGISGYAHLGELFNGRRGLALDVPFGIVDFIEVLQGGRLLTEVWYSFLNLGYRVLPVAGADFPYFGPTLPGVERTYVRVDTAFDADAWFAGFKTGRVYVSNGPFLQLTINDQEMGAELRVERGTPLEITARARLNPDIDRLERLELVVLGDVEATEFASGTSVTLHTELAANRSMWIALRAWGARQEPRNMIVAHSAPIYVVVNEQPTWKKEAVPELVAYQRNQLDDLLSIPIEPGGDLEPWETRALLEEHWPRQRDRLRSRIDEADTRYEEILQRAAENPGGPE